MTIDAEGLDLEVAQSNDWNKYRPKMILIEDLERNTLEEMKEKSKIYKFTKNRSNSSFHTAFCNVKQSNCNRMFSHFIQLLIDGLYQH